MQFNIKAIRQKASLLIHSSLGFNRLNDILTDANKVLISLA
jgi:hypothetical protein